MGKHSDRFSFLLTLFLTLVFLLYAVTALKKNELALFDLFSFDFESATLQLGEDEYTMDPAVKETLLAGASGAREAEKLLLPTPVREAADDLLFEGIFSSASLVFSGIDSAIDTLIRGNM